MTNKRITDVDFIESLNSDESFFVNQNSTIKQINKGNITFDIINGGTGANNAEGARKNLDAAPTSHASTSTTYGKGTSNNYGHVKLSDSVSSTLDVDDGVAATPSAVKAVYDETVNAAKSISNLDSNIRNVSSVVYIDTSTVSVPNGTEDFPMTLFIAPENGLYFIHAFAQWHAKKGGIRNARLYTRIGGSTIPASPTEDLIVQHVLSDCVYLPKNNIYNIALRQTSGDNLDCDFCAQYSYIPL